MRHLGRPTPEMQALPPEQAFRFAAIHQATGSALAAVNTVGMAKGIYRFKTQQAANAHADAALVAAIAMNIAARRVVGAKA